MAAALPDRRPDRLFPISGRTPSRESGGVELCLSICKWIAEVHGGRVEATTRLEGGVVFTVTLPKTA